MTRSSQMGLSIYPESHCQGVTSTPFSLESSVKEKVTHFIRAKPKDPTTAKGLNIEKGRPLHLSQRRVTCSCALCFIRRLVVLH